MMNETEAAAREAQSTRNSGRLEELALHEDSEVRAWVALNPATPLQLVQDLTMDSSSEVVQAAYQRLGITI